MPGMLSLPGCILFWTAVHTYRVKFADSPGHHTASVIIQGKPNLAFDALVNEAESMSDLDIIDIDRNIFLLEIQRKGKNGLFQITPLENDFFLVTVTMDAPGEKQKKQKDLTIQFLERVCEALNEECEIPEATPVKLK